MSEDFRQDSLEHEELSAEEKWKMAHPELEAGVYVVKKPKEKHSFGYWVKEFLRVGLLPAALVVGIWLGVGYLLGLL